MILILLMILIQEIPIINDKYNIIDTTMQYYSVSKYINKYYSKYQ